MTSDILVLGAGMVGVGTALALRQRGYQVTLMDRHSECRETSYGNAGIIQREALRPYAFPRRVLPLLKVACGSGNDVNYHWVELLRLAPKLARYWRNSGADRYPRIAEAYGSLIEHCLTEHGRLMNEIEIDDLVRKTGWLQAYRTPALLDLAASEAKALAVEQGLSCDILDTSALTRLQPALSHSLAGAIHWRDPWSVTEPGELVDRYVRLFLRIGGEFQVGTARTLEARSQGWRVHTEVGPIETEHLVIALGPWSERLIRPLGYHLPLFSKRGYHQHYLGGGTLSMPVLDLENGVMLAPMKRGLRISTGAEFASMDSPATPVQLRYAERALRGVLDLGIPTNSDPWIGSRPCTVDMKPIIGAAPKHRGLWFNFGHGHQGFTLGPASGRLLAELITGEDPFVNPAPFLPTRF
ncbi:FAD-dependent oxidoreductase [Curvibacter sp. RS43]|uniref:NAD(P)/FAD-dependent oxidoreductase n=1 Tax=Curvibacter microcysteis TaxID=3026419 RepID=UPI002362F792|nr:FAD-dependent oxidoreductase [Curvibacter sp. RS43]MDD0812873.1 FAD-dependent oxidoreductase [Curvibacter sp. RS43]